MPAPVSYTHLDVYKRQAQQHADKNFEFIFVDDGSFDDSYNILAAIAKNDNKVQIIKLSRNFGSNIALAAGLHYAQGNCAAMIAADLQDPPELISPMIDLWDNGTHVVMAARRQRADPLLTRLPAAIFNRAFRQFVFRDFPTNGYDFVLIDRKVIDCLLYTSLVMLFGQSCSYSIIQKP